MLLMSVRLLIIKKENLQLFSIFNNLLIDKESRIYNEESVFSTVHKFILQFYEIGQNKREGYQSNNIMPYLHVLLYTISFIVSHYGTLGNFSDKGVERTDDIIKQL